MGKTVLKRNNEIVETPKGNSGIITMPEMPDFMQGQQTGLEQLGQYISPPRLKIIQASSGDELKTQFGDGTVIITPELIPIVAWKRHPTTGQPIGENPTFVIVPLFFYPEYAMWNPYPAFAGGSVPAIIDRTLDKNHRIAQRAKSNNRTDPYPANKEWAISYVEHLNFMCRIFLNGEPLEKPVVISFARGEHKAGRDFAALLKMRKCPLFGGRYSATVVKRIKDDYNWFGLEISNPNDGGSPWITDPDEFANYQELYNEFLEAYTKDRIRVDYENDLDGVSEIKDTATDM